MTNCEPFLRWAGGKRQLLSDLVAALPADFDLSKHRFFEPFIGGAALTFALSEHHSANTLKGTKKKKGRPIVINDLNSELVATYRTVQQDVDALIKELRVLQSNVSEKRYYEVRAWSPQSDLERAARMVYLNRTGFNGLYRVNSAGNFNVPYGHLANPTVCNGDLLRECSAWLRNVEVREGSYASAVADAKPGDVVYFDPPYVPLSPTSSFSKYAKDDFREFDQWGLAGVIHGLIRRGVRVVLSNSNAPLTREIFGEDLDLYAVSAARSIGASASSRARVEEVLGLSYDATLAADTTQIQTLTLLSSHSLSSSVR